MHAGISLSVSASAYKDTGVQMKVSLTCHVSHDLKFYQTVKNKINKHNGWHW